MATLFTGGSVFDGRRHLPGHALLVEDDHVAAVLRLPRRSSGVEATTSRGGRSRRRAGLARLHRRALPPDPGRSRDAAVRPLGGPHPRRLPHRDRDVRRASRRPLDPGRRLVDAGLPRGHSSGILVDLLFRFEVTWERGHLGKCRLNGSGIMTEYIVGLRQGKRSEVLTIEAEDALIAALKVKHNHPEALISYVRKSNRRGERPQSSSEGMKIKKRLRALSGRRLKLLEMVALIFGADDDEAMLMLHYVGGRRGGVAVHGTCTAAAGNACHRRS